MSEPVDIVAEMRDQAEWQETALDNPFMAKDMRRWADHMERLQALVEWHRVELAKQIERTNTMSAEIETYKRMFED